MDENTEISCVNLTMLRKHALMAMSIYGDIPVCVVEAFNENGMPVIKPCNLLRVRVLKNPEKYDTDAIIVAVFDPEGNPNPMKISKLMEYTADIKTKYGENLLVTINDTNGPESFLQNIGIAILPPKEEDAELPRFALLLGNPTTPEETEGDI